VVEFDLQPLNSRVLLLDVLLDLLRRLLVAVEQLAADLFHKIKQSHSALLVVCYWMPVCKDPWFRSLRSSRFDPK
jgi:hypothetical protein